MGRYAIDYPNEPNAPDAADLIQIHQASTGEDRHVRMDVFKPLPVIGGIYTTLGSQTLAAFAQANTWEELVVSNPVAASVNTNVRQDPTGAHRLQIWRTGTNTSPVFGTAQISFGLGIEDQDTTIEGSILRNGVIGAADIYLTANAPSNHTTGTIWPFMLSMPATGLVDGDTISIGLRNPGGTNGCILYKPTVIFSGQETS